MSIKEQDIKHVVKDMRNKAGYKPLLAQIELTYRCPLHCEHCSTDCYNNKKCAENELSTNQIKLVLDKCKKGGILWLVFSGGDPLIRKDFGEIYLYAKKLGFLIIIFTSLIPLNKNLLRIFKKNPPFRIETTLNAATAKRYKKITKRNFFKKHLGNIKILIKNNLPVAMKTQVTKNNIGHLLRLKRLARNLGIEFKPDTLLSPRLNHDATICCLRVDAKNISKINKEFGLSRQVESISPIRDIDAKKAVAKLDRAMMFTCIKTKRRDFVISPDGKMFFCVFFRSVYYDLLQKNHTVKRGTSKIWKKIRAMRFKTNSKCGNCKYRLICHWCPARAFLETGSLDKPIDYFCELTNQTLSRHGISPSSF